MGFRFVTREKPPEGVCASCGKPFVPSGSPACVTFVEGDLRDYDYGVMHPNCYLVQLFGKNIPSNLCDTMASEHS